ncbi:hypothetical protein PN398_07930 [Romboutsia sp. 1001216sp1]|uniref:hypothetical protein n=1 Tax=unclassified Romboutsia TaxID=2626894 RepID=UPI0018A056DF|nr:MULTISPECIES: hypothetical protein [unclassified Romboutsia]MDB8790647.1 hypothetical protein [Romboutsia sp. 1001216sp1]MDB8803266.1 hypothetical protein [Romboutsia sp. 1001216sp1]MDB8814626.1 hypothetical protein [Romboutsia sp. 1001216sp1]
MSEQLKLLGNVIEFPKNQEVKNKEMLDKFHVATELLRNVAEKGYDFSITITRDAALEIFEVDEKKLKNLLVISTSKDFEREIKYQRKNYFYVKGNEF